MFIDAHAHLDEIKDLAPALAKSKAAGCVAIVSCGYSVPSSLKTLEIAEKNPGFVFPVIGISPQASMDLGHEEFEAQLAVIRKNVYRASAIGEIGLDFHWGKTEAQVEYQYAAFEAQVDLALSSNLPIVIHSRKAEKEAIDVLKSKNASKVMLHFFSGKPEEALSASEMGYLISFPPLESKNRSKAAKLVPLEKIVIETDCPYVAPDPVSILQSASIIAKAKGILTEEVLKVTSENAARFFNIGIKGML